MSLGQLVQTWSGEVQGEIVGADVLFELAFSNIDDAAPDGLSGPTDVLVEVSIE